MSAAAMDALVPTARPGSQPLTIHGWTFDGVPFDIDLALDEVDHGASAKIYKGKIQGQNPQVVAVKDFGLVMGRVQEQLLFRELRAARRVTMAHRFILPFIGTSFIGQHQAIVSLYMQNGNMIEYLKNNRRADRRRLILQVAEAVDYLHTVAGLVHGDLKCANVLISDEHDALLADFGLSTFIEKNDTRTMSAIRSMSTVAFAAPELLLGPSDPAASQPSKSRESDVYAFGMLILEAVTGLAPFHGLNNMAIMFKVGSGELPSRPTVNAFVGISAAWWDVCRSCWAFNPSDRPRMQLVHRSLNASTPLPNRAIFSYYLDMVWNVAYMPCGRRVMSCSNNVIEILDITTGQTVTRVKYLSSFPVAAVSPKGSEIASSAGDFTVQRWNAHSGDPLGEFMRGHTARVRCIAYSPDGTRIISASDDHTIRLWDASTGEAIGAPLEHTRSVESVAFSPDGSRFLSASNDKKIRIWDAWSGEQSAALTGHPGRVTCVSYLSDGRYIISGSRDNTVRMWSAESLQLVHTMRGHSELVNTVAVSPSGKYIASGSCDKSIRIWDTETGAPIGEPLTGHAMQVLSVAFSPDGKSLVSGSWDGSMRIWELFE